MTQAMPTQDSSTIQGHHWSAEGILGGFCLTVSGDDPGALDRAVTYLLGPTWRLEYWDLVLHDYTKAGDERWLLLGQFGNDLVTL